MAFMRDRSSFNISDLAESEEFAEFFTIVRQLTGIVTALAHPDGTLAKLLCPETEFNPLCRIILASSEGKIACDATNRFYCSQVTKSKRGLRYFCHAGLVDFAVPVYIEDWHIATINCGQTLSEKPSAKGFKKLCEKIEGIPVDMKKLHKVYFQSTYMPPEKLETVLRLISFYADYFCEVGRRLHPANQSKNHPQIIEAVKYLKEHFRDDVSLQDIASSVGLCETYFSRLFTKIIGVPYTHYLNNLRISEAKKLLEKTDWTITQIALDIGFNSLPYFNQIFSKFENCSPSQYRKNRAEEITKAAS
jgi:AraC-like DNA-binding protein/ligand-binding sensor protein